MAGLLDPTDSDRRGLLAYANSLPGQPAERSWLSKAGEYLYDKYGKPIVGALSLPGDVYAGRVDPKSDEGIARAADLAGLVTVGAGAIPGGRNELRAGIRAFHGSPHDFDRFSMDKIGTGEGAQAYGHGLYFAENEGVARGYRDNLTADRTVPAQRLLKKHGGNVDEAIAAARAEIDRLNNLNLTPETGLDRARSMIETQENNIAMLNALKNSGEMSAGRMYEVRINADPEQFLDWDKPLSEQPKAEIAVGRYLERVLDQPGPIMNDVFDKFERGQMTGADVAKLVGTDTTPLREAGIPGIKYLDAGSRSAGDGSRNYVVFDDKLVEIVKKYGWAPGMAIPAAMALEIQQAQEQSAQGPQS